MVEIKRIWLYKTQEDLANPDCKISETNQPVIKHVRGDFVYFGFNGEIFWAASRREAREWSHRTGKKVETIMGYPSFMHDAGYRA